jgi:hypothetical protein
MSTHSDGYAIKQDDLAIAQQGNAPAALAEFEIEVEHTLADLRSNSSRHFDCAGFRPHVVVSTPAASPRADEPHVLTRARGRVVKHSVQCRRFRVFAKGKPVGLAAIHIPELRFTISDVALHQKNAARSQYTSVIEFEGRETRDAFSDTVWQTL